MDAYPSERRFIMSIKNPVRWVRTREGNSLGFLYEPGSALKAEGVENMRFTLNGDWTSLQLDVANVAINKFGTSIEVVAKNPIPKKVT